MNDFTSRLKKVSLSKKQQLDSYLLCVLESGGNIEDLDFCNSAFSLCPASKKRAYLKNLNGNVKEGFENLLELVWCSHAVESWGSNNVTIEPSGLNSRKLDFAIQVNKKRIFFDTTVYHNKTILPLCNRVGVGNLDPADKKYDDKFFDKIDPVSGQFDVAQVNCLIICNRDSGYPDNFVISKFQHLTKSSTQYCCSFSYSSEEFSFGKRCSSEFLNTLNDNEEDLLYRFVKTSVKRFLRLRCYFIYSL